jgi:hypothetical protein
MDDTYHKLATLSSNRPRPNGKIRLSTERARSRRHQRRERRGRVNVGSSTDMNTERKKANARTLPHRRNACHPWRREQAEGPPHARKSADHDSTEFDQMDERTSATAATGEQVDEKH